ncbi:prephenate dehydratase [bacterium]|nr:prephenate dehydratase [bacterium]
MSELLFENIYYLGPDGSNTYNAMIKFLEKESISVKNKIPKRSIKEALISLEKDYSSICVLPMENSIEGIVRETIDNFLRFNDNTIQVQGEITLPIKHMLLSNCKKSEIKKIYSHPQALAQCSKFLYENFPDAELKEVSSTSYAAQKVSMEETNAAAIANESCSVLFGLNIVAHDINDEQGNETRFYILSRTKFTELKDGKTAIMVSTKNYSGALCDVLKVLSNHNINITCIDSRPSRKKLGEYIFFMELDGVMDDYNFRLAFEELTVIADFIKVLGSFKKY